MRRRARGQTQDVRSETKAEKKSYEVRVHYSGFRLPASGSSFFFFDTFSGGFALAQLPFNPPRIRL